VFKPMDPSDVARKAGSSARALHLHHYFTHATVLVLRSQPHFKTSTAQDAEKHSKPRVMKPSMPALTGSWWT